MQQSRRVLTDELFDLEYRYAYAEDFLNTWVATQIVTIREQRGLSQAELGMLIGTKQPGVSRLENVNHATWNIETLKKIARALDVRLKVSFEDFASLLDEDERFSRQALKRPKFEDDPAFKAAHVQRKQPASEISRSMRVSVSAREVPQALNQLRHKGLYSLNRNAEITATGTPSPEAPLGL